jgi:hypothetical protein
MIRREENGTWYLIRQDDHARLSGDLARQIGNERFQPLTSCDPDLAAKAILGISMHDEGWPLHDDQPTLNPRLHPRDVFESKTDQVMKIWTESANRAQWADPYAGLLVSLHGMGLSQFALSEVMHQFSRKNLAYTRDRFELNKFQHNEIERQVGLRKQLGFRMDVPLNHGLPDLGVDPKEDLLIHHFRSLQAMDRLSLMICFNKPPFDFLELATHPGAMLSRIKAGKPDPRRVTLDPWPFGAARIDVSINAKVLPATPFKDEANFRAAYQEAPVERLTFVLEKA